MGPAMLRVDVLSGYLICGAGSLVGAAMLRIADTSDARARQALRLSGWGFVVLGVGLLPAGLGPAVVHPASQFSLTFCTLAGLLLLGSGLGELQGRGLPLRWLVALIAASAAVLGWALSLGVRELGASFAVSLTLLSMLVVWLTRGMVMSPRDITEGALGMSLVVLAVSCVVRLAFTFADTGPARQDLMYVPEPWRSLLAVIYGVLPMIGATLLLTLVNARLRHQLRMRAITDELTGTMTRRALRELAPALIEQQQRQQHDVAVLMLDLDRFKDVNDTHGHQMGDAVAAFRRARAAHAHAGRHAARPLWRRRVRRRGAGGRPAHRAPRGRAACAMRWSLRPGTTNCGWPRASRSASASRWSIQRSRSTRR